MCDIFAIRHIVEGNTIEEKTFILTPVNITVVEDQGKKKSFIEYKDISNCIMIDDSTSLGMKVNDKNYFIFCDEAKKLIELIKQYKN